MPALFFLGLSILLQVIAVVLALRLIPLTRGRAAWVMIAAALLLIIVRRAVHLGAILAGLDAVGPSDLLEAVINLALSALLAAGVWFIRPLFVRMIRDREALREQMEEAQAVMDVTPAIIWVAHDPQCRRITGNRAANEFYRVPDGTNVSQTPEGGEATSRLTYFQNGREVAPQELPMQAAAAKGTTIRDAEIEVVYRDGTRRVVLGNASPLRGAGGEVRGVVAAFVDATERRRAEDALRKAHDELESQVRQRTAELTAAVEKLRREMAEHHHTREAAVQSEKKYRALAENTNDIAYSVDAQGRLTYVGPQVARYGFTPDEGIGTSFLEMVSPQDRDRLAAEFKRTISTGDEFPTCFRAVDKLGRNVWFEDVGKPHRDGQGKIIGLYGVLRDITDRKRAEEELRSREEWHRTILQAAMDGFWVVDMQTRLLDVNDAYCRMIGYSRQELLGMRIPDLEVHETAQETAAHAQKMVAQGVDRFESQHRRKDGSIIDVEVCIQYRPIDGGRFVAFIRDITERNRSEQELQAAGAKLRTLFKILPTGISIVDQGRRVVDANPALLRILGLSSEGLARADYGQRRYLRGNGTNMPPEEFPTTRALQERHDVQDVEIGVVKENGSTIWVLVSAAPLSESQVVVTVVDVTDRRRAAEELRSANTSLRGNAERLRSLASELTQAEEKERRRLAADLHDDLAQILVLVKIRLEMLGDSLGAPGAGEMLAKIVQLIGQAIASARSVMFRLVPPGLYDKSISFLSVAERLTESVQKEYGLQVTLEDDGLPKPMEDRIRVMLFRGLRELLINAAKHSKAKAIRVRLKRRGQTVRASVQDGGAGFDASTLAAGVPDGFGLLNVRERLEYLGGRMKIRSIPGKGTLVALRVPVAPDTSKVREASP